MELIIDSNFKRTYELYYEKLRTETVLESINETFMYHDPEVILDTVNVIKTSMTLGFTYSRCYDEVVKKILHRFPIDGDIDKFIVSLVLKVMVVAGSPNIEELMRSPRNIEREVASKHFRVTPRKVTDSMIEDIIAASARFTEDSYSVTDPVVDGWDDYFYNVCRQVARNSKCLSRRIGAVLVRDKSIISTGYNGPPRGIPRCDMRWQLDKAFSDKYLNDVAGADTKGKCPRKPIGFKSGEGLDICIATHAEVNAVVNAAMQGVPTKDASLYMTCFLPGNLVVTSSGYKNIENVLVGDIVLTKSGTFKKVIGVHTSNYSGEVTSITPKGMPNHSINCTSDHTLFGKKVGTCISGQQKYNRSCFQCYRTDCSENIADKDFEEMKASDIECSDYLYIPSSEVIEYAPFIVKQEDSSRCAALPVSFYFDEDYYWMVGLYIAEGCIQKLRSGYKSSVVFTLHINETDFAERLRLFFKRHGYSTVVKKIVEKNTLKISIHSTEIAKHLSNLCGEGAQNKRIPDNFMFTDKVAALISGIFDGDGTTIKSQKSITTISYTLFERLVASLLFTGYNVRYHIEESRTDKNGLSHKKVYRLYYSHNNKSTVNRKGEFIKIEDIRRYTVENEIVYDLLVEDDHSYVVGPSAVHNCGIPCHNCMQVIINAGIKDIIVTSLSTYDDTAMYLLRQSDVGIRLFDFIK